MTTDRGKSIVLITGSSGLIGGRIVRDLSRDFTVVGIDRNPPKEYSPADFIECDLTSDEDTERTLNLVRERHGDRLAGAIHLAAYYDFSGEPSPLYEKLTVEGTRRLLRELKKFGRVEQFIFTSTLLVMEPAEDKQDVITEQSRLEDDPWTYPESKIEAEAVIREEHGDIPATVLRIAGVYDEECHSLPVGQHIARIYEKQFESYFFPGKADHGTPYVHLDDLVDCVRRVIDRRGQLGGCRVYLIAEPDVMTHNDLQDTIGELIHGREWPTIRVPKIAAKAGAWVRGKIGDEEKVFIRPWMVDMADIHYPVAIKRAKAELGWNPAHRLRTTLPEMIRLLKRDPKRFYETNGLPLPDELEDKEEQRARKKA